MWKIGMIGFGNVGQGLVRILHAGERDFERKYGFRFCVTAIVDPVKGVLRDPEGLDLEKVLSELDASGSLKGLPQASDYGARELVCDEAVDIVVEATPTNLETGQPGLGHIRAALKSGKHVVSTNKGPVSVALPELLELATSVNRAYRFEGVLLSGTPAINMATESMAGCSFNKICGIVNGTTNFMLSRMEEGHDYPEALREAQELGYAEADPTADVEGWDAAVKAQVMANVFMGKSLAVEDIRREGITLLSVEKVRDALDRGFRIKLLAEVSSDGDQVSARVAPVEVPLDHPLAGVGGAVNALTFSTDHLGDVTVIGPGAGRVETGQALLVDILAINREYRS